MRLVLCACAPLLAAAVVRADDPPASPNQSNEVVFYIPLKDADIAAMKNGEALQSFIKPEIMGRVREIRIVYDPAKSASGSDHNQGADGGFVPTQLPSNPRDNGTWRPPESLSFLSRRDSADLFPVYPPTGSTGTTRTAADNQPQGSSSWWPGFSASSGSAAPSSSPPLSAAPATPPSYRPQFDSQPLWPSATNIQVGPTNQAPALNPGGYTQDSGNWTIPRQTSLDNYTYPAAPPVQADPLEAGARTAQAQRGVAADRSVTADRSAAAMAGMQLPLANTTSPDNRPLVTMLFFLLLCSIGLNIYLGWISRGFYVRYRELADELRETFAAPV